MVNNGYMAPKISTGKKVHDLQVPDEWGWFIRSSTIFVGVPREIARNRQELHCILQMSVHLLYMHYREEK
jgi:hypothetical protein